MPLYTASFTAAAVSLAQDLFEIVAPATDRVLIREIAIGQYSDFGDAEDELLSVSVIRGNTTSGSGGSTATPVRFNHYLRAAGSIVEVNNTTVASAGSPETVWADTWNIRAGWLWRAQNYLPTDHSAEFGIVVKPSERLAVRITAPVDALTMNGTLVFEEIGKAPVS